MSVDFSTESDQPRYQPLSNSITVYSCISKLKPLYLFRLRIDLLIIDSKVNLVPNIKASHGAPLGFIKLPPGHIILHFLSPWQHVASILNLIRILNPLAPENVIKDSKAFSISPLPSKISLNCTVVFQLIQHLSPFR